MTEIGTAHDVSRIMQGLDIVFGNYWAATILVTGPNNAHPEHWLPGTIKRSNTDSIVRLREIFGDGIINALIRGSDTYDYYAEREEWYRRIAERIRLLYAL